MGNVRKTVIAATALALMAFPANANRVQSNARIFQKMREKIEFGAADILLGKGKMLLQCGRFEEARGEFESIMKRFPEDKGMGGKISEIYLKEGERRYNRAIMDGSYSNKNVAEMLIRCAKEFCLEDEKRLEDIDLTRAKLRMRFDVKKNNELREEEGK